ncbi:hypothetical protein NC653_021044 [Populus alba x Populus x berolinensis]|uniref:Uncharacterized protein n=1 Tax=Populus alba x Populus x berolinensis TaxID=444605 RepID=A0AAD6QEQ3_9ROSI|nr:hypothetical protein NC653_021044 [Populus alba x Populus x berolinensis]
MSVILQRSKKNPIQVTEIIPFTLVVFYPLTLTSPR